MRRALIALFFLPALAAPADDPQPGPAPKPPSIVYGGSRTSAGWIEVPGGTRVAVDRHVEWMGTRVYLSLTDDLLAVDSATGKLRWRAQVGAFWNQVGFKEVEVREGQKAWAVELRPGPRARERERDLVQYHDLATGKKIELPGARPSGAAVTPRQAWSGHRSNLGARFRLLVGTQENWDAVRRRLFEGQAQAPAFEAVDFTKEVVLVLHTGDSSNSYGIRAVECWQDAKRVLVRTQHASFQSGRDGVPTRPWGIFVLPRGAGLAYVVEQNVQRYIGGPPVWKEVWHAEKLAQPDQQLEGLPK